MAEFEDDLPESDDLDALLAAPVRVDAKPLPDLILAAGENCPKCRGSGKFRGRNGRIFGDCYHCKGVGKLFFKTTPQARAQAGAKRAARKVLSATENLDAFKVEHPDVYAWFDGSTFPFAVSMREAVTQFGRLTDRQLAAAVTCVQKLDAAKAARAARDDNAVAVDLSKIEEALTRAAQTVGKPKLRLAGLTISLASSASANAGAYYVKSSANGYLGKIVSGKFIRTRECTDADEVKLIEFARDPKAAAIAYGRETGTCACCGRTLTNRESIELGIGPICAGNFFGGAD